MRELLAGMQLAGGASVEALDGLSRALPGPLPVDYIDVLRWSDGLEGYVGGRGYLRLWSAEAAVRFNLAYHVAEFVPGLFLFGTDAAALGYGFDLDVATMQVVSVELAGLHREYVEKVADSFSEFIERLSAEALPGGGSELADHRPPQWLSGHVIHETHPMVHGGSVEDPANRVLVPQDKHPEIAVFWSRVVHQHRPKGGTET